MRNWLDDAANAADLEQMSKDVVAMLDAQRKYFKTRSKEDLIECKRLESQLRKRAESNLEGNEDR